MADDADLTDDRYAELREQKKVEQLIRSYREQLAVGAWVEMLWQLRYVSKDCPRIDPGDCQAFFDWIHAREYALDIGGGRAPQLRHTNSALEIVTRNANQLTAMMPSRHRKERRPRTTDSHPIFVRYGDRYVLIDGRRRVNTFITACPDQKLPIYLITPKHA